MLSLAVVMCACEKDNGGQFTFTVDKNVINADGVDYATFSAKLGKKVLSEDEFEIFDKNGNPLSLPGLRFSTTEIGIYEFQAVYAGSIAPTISVKARKPVVYPDLPEDKNPSKLDFKRRILLTQFTGAECGWCPSMIRIIEALHREFPDEFIVAAAHRYTQNDPAYLYGVNLDGSLGISGFPYVAFDLNRNCKSGHYNSYTMVKSKYEEARTRTTAKAGIAAKATYDAEGRTIAISAQIKAAVKNQYRIGVWLLEDNIEGRQANYGETERYEGEFDIHHNCIRLADSYAGNDGYSGLYLGDVEAGGYAEKNFALDLEDIWVSENCKLIIFVSALENTSSGQTAFLVNNVVTMPIDGTLEYEYAK